MTSGVAGNTSNWTETTLKSSQQNLFLIKTLKPDEEAHCKLERQPNVFKSVGAMIGSGGRAKFP